MIDPTNITYFGKDQSKLEELILFSILVAGKTASTTARLLEQALHEIHGAPGDKLSPFEAIAAHGDGPAEIAAWLKRNRFGCYSQKGRTISELVRYTYWNGVPKWLARCDVEELEQISGIGPKTARFFVLHTRQSARLAVLDTHVLKYLRALGYKVPKSTPSGKRYAEIEKTFLRIAAKQSKSLQEFDLEIWNKYAHKPRGASNVSTS